MYQHSTHVSWLTWDSHSKIQDQILAKSICTSSDLWLDSLQILARPWPFKISWWVIYDDITDLSSPHLCSYKHRISSWSNKTNDPFGMLLVGFLQITIVNNKLVINNLPIEKNCFWFVQLVGTLWGNNDYFCIKLNTYQTYNISNVTSYKILFGTHTDVHQGSI